MKLLYMELESFKSLSKEYMSHYKDGKLIDFINWLEYIKLESCKNIYEYDRIFIGEVYKN